MSLTRSGYGYRQLSLVQMPRSVPMMKPMGLLIRIIMIIDQPQSYSSLDKRADRSLWAEPEITAMFCLLRSKRVRSLRRQSSSCSFSSGRFLRDDLMVQISSSMRFVSFSWPWKLRSSALLKNRTSSQGSCWYFLLTSSRQMKMAASESFLLSQPSTVSTRVWNRGSSLSTSSLDRLSPMQSQMRQLRLPS